MTFNIQGSHLARLWRNNILPLFRQKQLGIRGDVRVCTDSVQHWWLSCIVNLTWSPLGVCRPSIKSPRKRRHWVTGQDSWSPLSIPAAVTTKGSTLKTMELIWTEVHTMLPRIEFSPARQRQSNALRSSLSLQVESSLRFDSSGRFCHILVEATCKGRLGNLNRVELDLVEGRLKVKGLVEVIGPQNTPCGVLSRLRQFVFLVLNVQYVPNLPSDNWFARVSVQALPIWKVTEDTDRTLHWQREYGHRRSIGRISEKASRACNLLHPRTPWSPFCPSYCGNPMYAIQYCLRRC